MIAAVLGLAAALGLGIADFMSRFSARALGAPLTYGAVLLIGTIGASAWVLLSGVQLVWSPLGWGLAIAHGIFVALMCMLLYAGLARGPVSVVAPIVAAHPVPVLAVNVAMGVRPGAMQWLAMVAIIIGSVFIARLAVSEDNPAARADRTTLQLAFGACFAYAALVLTGQAAAPLIGETETMWIGRWSGLVFIAAILLWQGTSVRIPAQWVPYVIVQGGLDTLGYFAFLAGSTTASPHVTMVVASAFSVVTVLLAWLVIREPIGKAQWGAIALIAAGTAILAGT
ncbi:MAG: DMT family transporter [Hyphomicrobiales bacterium]